MKKLRYIVLGLAVVCIMQTAANAQNENTSIPLISTLPQASGLNPGILPEYKFTLGLPGLMGAYVSLDVNFISARPIFEPTEDGYIDMDRIYEGLVNRNRITNYNEIPLFHVGFRGEKSHTAVSITSRNFTRLTVPKDIIGLPIYGNNSELFRDKERIDLSGGSFNSRLFTEVALTHGREIMNNLTVGVKLKYLIGHYDISMNQFDAQIGNYTTDSLYFATNEFDINAAGLMVPVLRGDEDIDYVVDDPLALMAGNGFAIDMGAQYILLDRFKLFASINDLGRISWNRNNATFRVPEASVGFRGIEDVFNIAENGFDAETDSIIARFTPTEVESEGYGTWLNAKLYAGAGINLTQNHEVGALLFSEIYRSTIIPAFSFYYNLQYKTMLDLVANVTVMNRRVDNVGVGFTAKLLGVQLFFVTNSILSYTNPLDARNLSLRIGTNFNFGNINKNKTARRTSNDAIILDI